MGFVPARSFFCRHAALSLLDFVIDSSCARIMMVTQNMSSSKVVAAVYVLPSINVVISTPAVRISMKMPTALSASLRERRSRLSISSLDPEGTLPVRIASRKRPSAAVGARFFPLNADTPMSSRCSTSSNP
jgi:hypothetical protein